MNVETPRLRLAPLAAGDIDAFVAYRQHGDVARYQSWSVDYSRADAEALVADQPRGGRLAPGEWLQLAVHPRGSSPGVGELWGDVAVGCDPVQPDTYELGVTLPPSAQGRGYAVEAVAAVRDALFEAGAHRVVMQADARNASVIRLMQRLGLRHEGTLLDADWFKGEWTTLERYAQLRREWAAATA